MSQSNLEAAKSLSTQISSLTDALLLEEKLPVAQALKVQLANSLRMMADNQKILNTSVAEDRALRQQRHQFREHQMGRLTGTNGAIKFPEPDEEMGDIRVDSPSTINHNYPAPPVPDVPASKRKLWPWIAGLIGTGVVGGGLGAGAVRLLSPTTTVPPATNTTSGFLIDLGEKPK